MLQAQGVRWVARLAGAVAAAALAVLAGCSSTSPGTSSPSGGSAPISSTTGPGSSAPMPSSSRSAPEPPSGATESSGAMPIPTAGAGPSPTAPSGGFGPGGTVTKLTGTIEAGVESGCVVLVGANGAVQANLPGLDLATAPLGSTVVVTGKFRTGMMTTCQQGQPFVVAAVEVK